MEILGQRLCYLVCSGGKESILMRWGMPTIVLNVLLWPVEPNLDIQLSIRFTIPDHSHGCDGLQMFQDFLTIVFPMPGQKIEEILVDDVIEILTFYFTWEDVCSLLGMQHSVMALSKYSTEHWRRKHGTISVGQLPAPIIMGILRHPTGVTKNKPSFLLFVVDVLLKLD